MASSDFDELMALSSDDDSTGFPAAPTDEEAALDADIAALEAQLAKADPIPADDELEPKRARAKELRDQVARKTANAVENSPTQFESAQDGEETLLIHFEEDGFLALGEVWYRGQELEIVVGGTSWEETKDRNGRTWLDLVDDPRGQIERYGKVMFASGPFIPRKGETFDDELVQEDNRRGRAAPVPRV